MEERSTFMGGAGVSAPVAGISTPSTFISPRGIIEFLRQDFRKQKRFG
jgi:hypothetical protein